MAQGKYILSKNEVQELAFNTKYKPENPLRGRCIDGRYPPEPEPAALAMAGADAGELAVMYAAAAAYGFDIDQDKAFGVLAGLVGGAGKLSFHTDDHHESKSPIAGCGYFKLLSDEPQAFGLTKEDIDFIVKKQLTTAVKAGVRSTELTGPHFEGAVVQVEGSMGILPQYTLETESGTAKVSVFIYHRSLVDRRHELLAKRLIEEKAVKLLAGLDADYLAKALSETSETHTFETLKRLAAGLPYYNVTFKDDGDLVIMELGNIPSVQ